MVGWAFLLEMWLVRVASLILCVGCLCIKYAHWKIEDCYGCFIKWIWCLCINQLIMKIWQFRNSQTIYYDGALYLFGLSKVNNACPRNFNTAVQKLIFKLMFSFFFFFSTFDFLDIDGWQSFSSGDVTAQWLVASLILWEVLGCLCINYWKIEDMAVSQN